VSDSGSALGRLSGDPLIQDYGGERDSNPRNAFL
jgi:hypothetical protein